MQRHTDRHKQLCINTDIQTIIHRHTDRHKKLSWHRLVHMDTCAQTQTDKRNYAQTRHIDTYASTHRQTQAIMQKQQTYRHLCKDTQIDIRNYAQTWPYRHLCIDTDRQKQLCIDSDKETLLHRYTVRHKQLCRHSRHLGTYVLDTQIDIRNYAQTRTYRHLCIDTQIDISNYA